MSFRRNQAAASAPVPFDPTASKVMLRMKALDEWFARVFDASPLGMLRVDLDFKITYANKKAMQICGIDSFQERSILDFAPDDPTIADLKERVKNRIKGVSEEYEVEIRRASDGQRTPVRVVAMPAFDKEGMVIGAVTILRTLEVERASEAILEQAQSLHTSEELLCAVATETRKVIPFDACSVTLYSENLEHARILFTDSSEFSGQSRARWFRMTPLLRSWAQHQEPVIVPDVVKFMLSMDLDHEQLEQNVANVRKFGWSSFLRYPIVREARVIGSFVLSSKQRNAYDENHLKKMTALPLDTALSTALHYDEVRDLHFRLALVRDVLRCKDNRDIFALVVNRLANHYEWESISIFQVNYETERITLRTQATREGQPPIPLDYEQDMHDGILGIVTATGQDINISNVEKDARFRNIFLRIHPSTRSELCMPIKIGGRVFALLNIEDSLENAFAPEEADALRLVLREVETAIERFRNDQLINATYAATPAAVWVTDIKGKIERANPAAETLLGFTEEELTGKLISQFFQDPDVGEAVIKARAPVSREVVLLNRSGAPISVLLGGSLLERDFAGERVITARDLRGHKRVEEIELLDQLFYEIATQVKTPLALSFNWLQRLRKKLIGSDQEVLDKVLGQLQKAEISYDRLALFNKADNICPYREMPLDLYPLLNSTLNEFPKADREMIRIDGLHPGLTLVGDPFQLSFVFRSILSYLLRFQTESEQISMKVKSTTSAINIVISGTYAPLSGARPMRRDSDQALLRILSEMALGGDVIKKFVLNHHGTYYEPELKGDSISFRMDLPWLAEA